MEKINMLSEIEFEFKQNYVKSGENICKTNAV